MAIQKGPIHPMENTMKDFKNILLEFQNHSDFLWATRLIQFTNTNVQQRVYNRCASTTPSQLKKIVASSDRLHEAISKLVSESEIKNILDEIGFDYDLPTIRVLGLILVKILKKSLSGLYVNENKLASIKSEMGNCPVIFVPTHRSYGDFILMAFICFKYNINIPCVAAGMDFLSMWLMSNVLRSSRAFFLRRKFANDPIYRAIFKEYIRFVVSHQESPIEFFIEGTRSRTGKSLMPKFGMLSMLVDCFLNGDIPDLTIVPVNISYDRVLEESLFSYELLGTPKPKESTKELFKGLKVLAQNYGNIFINFGDPFSIRSIFNKGNEPRHNYLEEDIIKNIQTVAFKIITLHQSLQTYGCFHLLALALNYNMITKRSYTLRLEDAVFAVNWLLDLFDKFEAHIYIQGTVEAAIKNSVSVHCSLVELSSGDDIILKTNFNTMKNNTHLNLKGNHLDERVMSEGLPLVMLQIYVNPSLNLLIRSSVIICILKSLHECSQIPEDLLYLHYLYLCGIFKYEFVILNNSAYEEYRSALSKLEDLNAIEINNNLVQLGDSEHTLKFFSSLLQPFLTAASAFENFLHEVEVSENTQPEIVKLVQSYIESSVLSGSIKDYYCLSLDLISNLMNAFIEMDVINKGHGKFVVNRSQLRKMRQILRTLIYGTQSSKLQKSYNYIHFKSKL